jgi:hypothetical protein
LPPSRAFDEVRRAANAAERDRIAAREQSSRRRALVSTVADMQRVRRKRSRVKRLAAIVPASDYRDISG